MGKGGGGRADTSGLERATASSEALQREIFEQTREDFEPFRGLGVGSAGRLADLLGVTGGSVQGREDIYQDLLPQYTSQQQVGGGDFNRLITPEGRIIGEGIGTKIAGQNQYSSLDQRALNQLGRGEFENLGSGYAVFGGIPQQRDVTDFEALNAAVESRLVEQGQTPEDFGSLLQTFGAEQFEEDPGFQYRQQEAQEALERSLSAQGVTLGGGGYGTINPQVAEALQQQQQGLASQEFGSAFDRYNIGQQNIYNRLLGATGIGQGATTQVAGAGQQLATNVGNLQTGLAQAQLDADIAEQSRPSGFSSFLGAVAPIAASFAGSPTGSAAIANLFSDERLKENIELVGHEMGHNIYEFDYKDGSGRFRGVMAQEVLEKEPEAVTTHSNGFMMVNYDKIGLKMETVQ